MLPMAPQMPRMRMDIQRMLFWACYARGYAENPSSNSIFFNTFNYAQKVQVCRKNC